MTYSGIDLIRELSLTFGPSGCENAVAELIETQIKDVCDEYYYDKVGNLIAVLKGRGMDYELNAASPDRVMLCAHMDEVGFMVTDITDAGYIKFGNVGGIDPRVMCGRPVEVGDERLRVSGVIASKAIHLQTAEERKKTTPVKKMYIDIGALDGDDAKAKVSIGQYGTFVSDFVTFGKDKRYMKGKALDDRVGCALMIEVMRSLKENPCDRNFDLYFAFTRCEEVGISGANVAAHAVSPSVAIILESTAVADIEGVDSSSRVAELGGGGVISFADRLTVYDQTIVDFALGCAERREIKCQIKRYVSGGNDAGAVQRSTDGVKTLALSLPTRYIHSASNVAMYEDYESMLALTDAMIRDMKLFR